MGWKWVDEPSDSLPLGREFDGAGEVDGSSTRSADDQCFTRRIVSSNCRTEEVGPGRFIRKCENTETILRSCVGRPTQVVESKTEHTEDDVTDEVKRGMNPFGSLRAEPFTFPGLRSDIEAIERELRGGFTDFMEAAEGIANEFFDSFNIPSLRNKDPSHFPQRDRFERPVDLEVPKKKNESYSEFAGEIKEV